jgi:hypothetical protein
VEFSDQLTENRGDSVARPDGRAAFRTPRRDHRLALPENSMLSRTQIL